MEVIFFSIFFFFLWEKSEKEPKELKTVYL